MHEVTPAAVAVHLLAHPPSGTLQFGRGTIGDPVARQDVDGVARLAGRRVVLDLDERVDQQ